MKKNSFLFYHTLAIGLTALTVGYSASQKHIKPKSKTTAAQKIKEEIKKDSVMDLTFKTLAESLGTPAPVLKADGRRPQSIQEAASIELAKKKALLKPMKLN